jgi:hypothetical protein
MIDQPRFLAEMLSGTRGAFRLMAIQHPDVAIYSVSIWTDVAARRSAISFDTFTNSEAKRDAANTIRQKLRDRFILEGDVRRLSLVPADMKRNTNPADFAFRKVSVIENMSLNTADSLDDEEWSIVERVLEETKDIAAHECIRLNLHPDAELGISGRNTWYHRAVKIPVV